jgi:hypothetical protein
MISNIKNELKYCKYPCKNNNDNILTTIDYQVQIINNWSYMRKKNQIQGNHINLN